MPACESEAIILRTFPMGEGDRLVSFLSRTGGRMRGVAAGARKPKSRFGSTLEPLSYIRIWFYERETRDLVRINQCELIESFLDAQRDYTSGLALALASEVTDAVLGEREVAEPNFRLLLVVARAIKAGAKPRLVLAYFALWTVRLGGWLPRLDRCVRCGTELAENAYVSEGHGFACVNCRLPEQRSISQAALRLARRMIGERLEELMKEPLAAAAAPELMDYMLDFIELHMEKRLQSRRLLAQDGESLT